jgi:branched-chain amino acid aminotransferase
MQYPQWIWQNGAIKPWADATAHVMSHALHYGSSVFEGIRAYDTPDGPAIFRLSDHNRRLFASARIYEMDIPYTFEQVNAACREVLQRNGLKSGYLRPLAYRGLGGFGLSAQTPIDVAVAAWGMGPYLGADALEQGIDACVSSWQRFAPNTIPAGAKRAGWASAKASRWPPPACSARARARTCSWCSTARCTPRRSAPRCSTASPATR